MPRKRILMPLIKPTRNQSTASTPSSDRLTALGLSSGSSMPQARRLRLGILALSLLMCGGCAGLTSVAPPPISVCNVPRGPLAATAEPQLSDVTNGDLLEEGEAVRLALRACNADKAAILDYLKRKDKR